jgi:hypothetical protein
MISFKNYLLESKKLKQYTIQVPPSTKEECIKTMMKVPSIVKGPWFKNINGKDVKMDPKEAMNDMSLPTVRHEALHAKQHLNIPEIFKGLPELTHNFGSSEEYKKKHYYNRPPEIMAYAYDTVMGVDSKKNQKTFEEIGGEVYELFQHYVEEYKKVL